MKINISKCLLGDEMSLGNIFDCRTVDVDAIRLMNISSRQKIYEARVLNPSIFAPNALLTDGELWCSIKKKENKSVKIPVLRHGEQVYV